MMSSVDAAFPAAAAPRVGADLRAARERLGLDLFDVALALRIRLPYLQAIEDGRTDELPGNAYAVGFLRTYGAALGLDPDEIARRFRAEASTLNQKTRLSFPVPVPERGVPAGAVVLLGVILAIGAYAGWYRLSGDGVLPAEVVPPVPERLAPLAQQAIPPPLPPTEAALPAQVAQVVPANAPPVGHAASVPAYAAAAALPPQDVHPEPVAPPPPDTPRIVVRARADAWIQVRDKAGQLQLNRVLRAGETAPIAAGSLMTTGNAGGTDILVDGVVVPSLGGAGSVRRDILMDADILRNGKSPAQLAALAPAPRQYGPAAPPPPAPAAQPQ